MSAPLAVCFVRRRRPRLQRPWQPHQQLRQPSASPAVQKIPTRTQTRRQPPWRTVLRCGRRAVVCGYNATWTKRLPKKIDESALWHTFAERTQHRCGCACNALQSTLIEMTGAGESSPSFCRCLAWPPSSCDTWRRGTPPALGPRVAESVPRWRRGRLLGPCSCPRRRS